MGNFSVRNAGGTAVPPGEACWQAQWGGPMLVAQG